MFFFNFIRLGTLSLDNGQKAEETCHNLITIFKKPLYRVLRYCYDILTLSIYIYVNLNYIYMNRIRPGLNTLDGIHRIIYTYIHRCNTLKYINGMIRSNQNILSYLIKYACDTYLKC